MGPSNARQRSWSLFGNLFSKHRNRLAMARAKKIAHIRANRKAGVKGVHEQVVLSIEDLLDGV